MLFFFMAFIFIPAALAAPFTNDNQPICTIYTPHSILEHKEDFKPHVLGGRTRYSTCTGAAWFHENYLALLNLYGKKIGVYLVDRSAKTAQLIQEITNADGAQLYHPENLVTSPDGTLLAVCSDSPNPGVKLFSINATTHLINPTPVLILPARELVHNVRFTPDGTYVATTGWDNERALCVYRLHKDNYRLDLVHSTPNTLLPLKPKGINFTKDGHYAVTCYAPRVTTGTQQSTAPRETTLVSYTFDSVAGTLGAPVSVVKLFSSAEDIALLNNDTAVMISDQANDKLLFYSFNPQTGQFGTLIAIMQNPKARLSFPHGIGVAPDGRYVAVTNYGDDSCTIYEIEQGA